jgi:hypothetical protein
MSIQTFKKKGIITSSSATKISGKPPGGIWISQGPFGSLGLNVGASGLSGFSINGGTRNVGYIGKTSHFSTTGTPFVGTAARGWGGTNGLYPPTEPLFNFPDSRGQTQGRQYQYIKPSVLSTKGQIRKQYRKYFTGQYPNNWVQPVYGNSNLSDNASQQVYIDQKAAAHVCVNDTNKPEVYVDNFKKGGATGCSTTTAKRTSYNTMDSAGLYTKTLNIPQVASQYTLQVQRRCSHPVGPQKPFPFAQNNSHSSSRKQTPGPPPPIPTPYYLSPPKWYLQS